jgi:hypothetical protein
LQALLARAWPIAVHAQQPVIGFLSNSRLVSAPSASFLKGLAETGYFDGKSVTIDFRSSQDQNDRLSGLRSDWLIAGQT